MQIQAGKYYRQRNGDVVVRATALTEKYQPDGRMFANETNDDDLVSEVEVHDVLPFALRAGVKYDTQKPDGSPGPVVTLRDSGLASGAGVLCPWDVRNSDGLYNTFPDHAPYANSAGEIYGDVLLARITGEHVEKLTAIERLQDSIEILASARNDDKSFAFALIRSVIADLKASQAK